MERLGSRATGFGTPGDENFWIRSQICDLVSKSNDSMLSARKYKISAFLFVKISNLAILTGQASREGPTTPESTLHLLEKSSCRPLWTPLCASIDISIRKFLWKRNGRALRGIPTCSSPLFNALTTRGRVKAHNDCGDRFETRIWIWDALGMAAQFMMWGPFDAVV